MSLKPMNDSTALAANYRPLKILYFSCHEILEYDDLRILTSLGHSVFSLGAFCLPHRDGLFRKARPEFFPPDEYMTFMTSGSKGPEYLTTEYAARFDVLIVNNNADWVQTAVTYMGGRPIIYRSLGQSTVGLENAISAVREHLTVVRYAEGEASLPGFMATDAVIHFGKFDPNIEHEWTGGDRFSTFHNNYPDRSHVSAPSLAQYNELCTVYPLDLWGNANESVKSNRGLSPADEQDNILRRSAGYFYVPTIPGSYSLGFVEAVAAGVPVIAPTASFIESAIDRSELDARMFRSDRWQVPSLLGHDSGLLYDDLAGAKKIMDRLLHDRDFAHASSARMREVFFRNFDARVVGHQWGDLLAALCP